MHLRAPAVAHGVVSFIWAVFLGGFIFIGCVAVGVSQAMSAILAAVSAFLIFLFVRVYGEDEPRRPD